MTDAPTTGWSRVDRYLTRDRLVVYPIVVAALFVVFWVSSWWFVAPLPDFVARWTAGRLVADGRSASLYDPVVQSAVQAELGSDALSWFVSPPHVAVLMVPFGLLPYAVAAALWAALTFALLWFSVRTLVALDPVFAPLAGWRSLVVAGSCQIVLELVGAGQDSAVVLAAFALGARLLAEDSAPMAGAVLSVALIKPQLVWLVPLVLVARRAWAALAGFAVGSAVLVAGSVAVLGTGAWTAWLQALTSPLYRDEVVVGQTAKNTSINGLVEHLVPGTGWPATVLWLIGFLVVAGLTIRHRGTLRDLTLPVLLVTVVPLVTVLLSPHAMVYDLVLVYPAVAWLLTCRTGPDVRGLVAVGYVLLFFSPLVQVVAREVPAASVAAAPWVVLVLIALWWKAIRPQEAGAASNT